MGQQKYVIHKRTGLMGQPAWWLCRKEVWACTPLTSHSSWELALAKAWELIKERDVNS